jgi:hypothetical protein
MIFIVISFVSDNTTVLTHTRVHRSTGAARAIGRQTSAKPIGFGPHRLRPQRRSRCGPTHTRTHTYSTHIRVHYSTYNYTHAHTRADGPHRYTSSNAHTIVTRARLLKRQIRSRRRQARSGRRHHIIRQQDDTDGTRHRRLRILTDVYAAIPIPFFLFDIA